MPDTSQRSDRTAVLRPGPVRGRTYCLYGSSDTTAGFYEALAAVADECQKRWPDLPRLLTDIRAANRRPLLGKIRRAPVPDSPGGFALSRARETLGEYLGDVEGHLGELTAGQRGDTELATTRDQYLLYSVEFELTNRRNIDAFKQATRRLAFLPHCLREKADACRCKSDGFDYVCTECAPACYLREVTRILNSHDVGAYIWMQADLSKVLKQGAKDPGSLGVLGLACIPELVAGMRKCDRAGIPAVGIPLDGNCCSRWWGELGENTVDLDRLEALLGG